jgi:hypothetical protein
MAVFTPPTEDEVRWNSEGETGIFAFLKPGPRGVNVYKLLNGNFTESQPSDMDTVEKIYHGGHVHPLTSTEEAELIAGGYGDYIT